MNNIYNIKNKTIKEVLDNIDSFITNMENFTAKHTHYNYDIKVFKIEDKWNADITITNDNK